MNAIAEIYDILQAHRCDYWPYGGYYIFTSDCPFANNGIEGQAGWLNTFVHATKPEQLVGFDLAVLARLYQELPQLHRAAQSPLQRELNILSIPLGSWHIHSNGAFQLYYLLTEGKDGRMQYVKLHGQANGKLSDMLEFGSF